jgi:hypothetical protein
MWSSEMAARPPGVVKGKRAAGGKTSVSGARTPKEIREFWDSHSLDDAPGVHEVQFEVADKRLGILDWVGKVDYYDDYDPRKARRPKRR